MTIPLYQNYMHGRIIPLTPADNGLLMQEQTPFLVAHRGYPARFPENTLEGLSAALAAGARYLEFDIQLSSDGVPVLTHDRNLMRTAGADIEVSGTTFADLKKYSPGEPGRFGNKFAHVRIPSLEETVELLKDWPGAQAFVEIKRGSLRHFGRRAVLAAVLNAIRPALEQCIPISFDLKVIREIRKLGACRTGWVVKSLNAGSYRQAAKLSPDFLFFNLESIPAGDQPLGQEGWEWVAYVVNQPEQALQLAVRGVRYVETDRIGEMLEHPLLKPKGSHGGG